MSLRPLWRSLGPAVRPGRVCAVLPQLGAVRAFADRKTGTVKLWNDQKGFGFITPSEGGEDVFVHRTGIAEGVTLSPGLSVSFAPEWDDKKRKDRASDVQLEAGGEGSTLPASDQQGSKVADSHHIVGSWEKWSIHKKAMAGEDSVFRQQVTIRDDAPKVGELRREEFQIVGNASWDIRLYPGGGDKQEVVVLKPGGPGSKAATGSKSKGHGRNWAVEGQPGDNIDVTLNTDTMMVSAETVGLQSFYCERVAGVHDIRRSAPLDSDNTHVDWRELVVGAPEKVLSSMVAKRG
ncbi:GRP-2, partial [Symbiodinium sp. KB8]